MKLLQPLKKTAVWTAPSVVILVLANLIPLAGVMFFGWAVFPIMLLFWLENVVVGALNALKMLVAGGPAPLQVVKLFLVPFFCVHYGGFTLVHGVFVFAMFGGKKGPGGGMFPTWDYVWSTVQEQHLIWAVVGLVLSHAFSFGWNYLHRGEFRRTRVDQLMMQPYGRVVVLHVAILGGGFLIMALGSPAAGLALLIVLKIILDVLAHVKQHALSGAVPLQNRIAD
jgi:hypothetical protein